jgi:hypothetical protein
MDDFFASFDLVNTIDHLTNLISKNLPPNSENADISTRLKLLNEHLTAIRKLANSRKIEPKIIHPLQQIINKLIPKEGVVKLNLEIDSLDKNLQLLQYWHQIAQNPRSGMVHSLFRIYMVTLTLKT